MKEFRCAKCKKLLFKVVVRTPAKDEKIEFCDKEIIEINKNGLYCTIEIKCKCGYINYFKTYPQVKELIS